MSKNNIDNNDVIKHAIEQMPVRIRRAKKKQYELANEAGITEGHLSQILNFKIKKSHTATLNKIQKVLSDWGV